MAPRWRSGQYDTDGKEFVYGSNVRHIAVRKVAGEMWDPDSPEFIGTGIGRDGQIYDGGVACGQGPMNNRRHSLVAQEPFGFYSKSTGLSAIGEGTVTFQGKCGQSKFISSSHRWWVDGDFLIDVNWTSLTAKWWHDNTGCLCRVFMTAGDYAEIRCAASYAGQSLNGRVQLNYDPFNTGACYASWREVHAQIERVGNTVSVYGWDRSAVKRLLSTRTHVGLSGPAWIELGVEPWQSWYGWVTTAWQVTAAVAEGTILEGAAWSRESSNAHRGLQVAVPDRVLVVTGDSSVNLIGVEDPEDAKLWSRKISGFGRTLPQYGVMSAFKDGCLLTCNTGGAPNYALRTAILSDLTLDDTRLLESAWGSGAPGAFKRGYNPDGPWFIGYNTSPIRTTSYGRWQQRNIGGSGWGGYTAWGGGISIPGYQLRSRSCTCVDCGQLGDQLVWAAGHQRIVSYGSLIEQGGVWAASCTRWYLEDSGGYARPKYGVSSEVETILWVGIEPQTGVLYYQSATKTYRAAAWKSGLSVSGGSWSAELAIITPGTRSSVSLPFGSRAQFIPAFITPFLMIMAATEGVYLINWLDETPQWQLAYGKVGSGAAVELEIDYDRVDAVTVPHTDGVYQLFSFAVRDGTNYYVHLVNHSTGELVGSEDVTSKMGGPVVSMAA
ncbi:MAG: hypothetical protein MUC88_00490 [Planctomycetes bacterium]|jgi:hypothetical protein|nr:hypothetical protein [Planctomycetota bacterium]